MILKIKHNYNFKVNDKHNKHFKKSFVKMVYLNIYNLKEIPILTS